MMRDLTRLADLLRQRNDLDREIAALTGRPALPGHLGEYIAAAIFDIELHPSAVSKGSDGRFRSGPLAGRTVNVKWYSAFCGLLDIRPDALPEYFLVLAGPRTPAVSSRNTTLPLVIASVYLFQAATLVHALTGRVKIGVATSVAIPFWDAAELYPTNRNTCFPLSDEQRRLLSSFRP